MMKKNLLKKASMLMLAGAMMIGGAMTAHAAGWQKNDTGWWYSISDDNSTWYSSCWQWIDGNQDGVAECYYFDPTGYLLVHTTTPDGYTVNPDGAWTENGVVQTKASGVQAAATNTQENTYNAQGVSNIALEMVENTREQNAKFGEVSVWGEHSARLVVDYANGFTVFYPTGIGRQEVTAPIDNRKLLFKYYDDSLSNGTAIEKYVVGLGLGFKSGYGETSSIDTGCTIKLSDGHIMGWGSGSISLYALKITE